MPRFVVLDSWRGLSACLVALYHLHYLDVYSNLYEVPLLQNSWQCVDFFFVLSGFVIAANYQQRLLQGFGAWRFLVLRLGRLYPLHFVMLAVAIALKLLLSLAPAWSSITEAGSAPFSTPEEAPDTILANLLLIHALHLYDFLTWNAQSWSISTEFYTYVVFAACLVGFRGHAWIALPIAMIGGPILLAMLSRQNLATDVEWGIIRCLYGFAAGVLVWNIYGRWHERLKPWLSGSIPEWCAIAFMLAFMSLSGKTFLSLAAPYVFGLVVLVFAFETGTASAILRLRPLVFLGTVSYSIYMTHVFIARRLLDVGRALDKWGLKLLTQGEIDGEQGYLLGTQLWHGDIFYLVYVAIVVAVSYFTYHWIEKPARDWVRNRIQARQRRVALHA
ncbi:MAG: acyltransferase family protein [Burkholderiales bacterium]